VGTVGSHRLFVGVVLIAALGAGLASAAAAQTPAPYVKVFVDGAPVTFDQPPMIGNGRVLVPLRGVFEQLGATVTWDPSAQTVLAERGATSVSLRIGSSQAFVNGQPQVLDAPAMLVAGRTLVPLRFISQALGAVVAWDAASSTVQITSAGPASVPPSANGVPAAGAPPSVTYGPIQAPSPTPVYQAPQTITGTVMQVSASAYPGQITVQAANGGVFTYQVASGTAVTRTDTATGTSGPVLLSAIAPGDAVTITADPTGAAQTIQDLYTMVNGTVRSIGYNRIVLQNGQTYPFSPVVRVTRGGLSVAPAALQPGDVVALRIGPTTGLVYGVDAAQTAAGLAPISAVTISPTGRPLVPGDVMSVVATGPAGGAATFSIDGVRAGLPMRESISQPGTYIGTYAIQPGDHVTNTDVVVSVTAPNNQVLTATAPTLVSINSPAVAQAGAPVITSPTPGAGIRAPFTVAGTAPAGSLVRVEADYAGPGTPPAAQSTLGTQTVTADANGNWSATFNPTPPVRGVNVTISAVLVDNTGAARTPSMTINTTLQ